MVRKLSVRCGLAAAALLFSVNAHADLFGLFHGRSANPGNMAPLSAELGAGLGGDLFNLGARINYKLSDTTMVYGDFGLINIDSFGNDADGFGFGVGVYYYLPNQRFTDNFDVALHGNFHLAPLEVSNIDADYNMFGLDVLISPIEPINDNGMSWWASAGLGRLAVEVGSFDDSDFEVMLSGGVTFPYGRGEVYAGAEMIDEFRLGAGYRLGL